MSSFFLQHCFMASSSTIVIPWSEECGDTSIPVSITSHLRMVRTALPVVTPTQVKPVKLWLQCHPLYSAQ
ncbi:hypothetical protein PGT21_015724 [Puccinia graminis f. sp. tritici]|uniref:Uncharacterized protein n=1 Tax=Puccinia graminis f. sp. tritici TaxID=56615 RepID=A0A5B0RU17_PUCGR|nr:hypothetical protein PGT21_015724 [Puccinia graminis f. sp. tritici]KAA1129370.1 hypothetical protein PGTUg99_030223 [Puccinia graminis f. sp. tritici]